ncbi:MAG: MmcQ/YjbR family DNA-binding protein [Thiolinea sp.]
MDYDAARTYLLSLPEAVETFPFGPDVAVFKVRNKMFATLGIEKGVANTNLKCEPNHALMLRDLFPAVKPGYHMNKKHWNTVDLDGLVPVPEIEGMMDESFWLVVAGMKKADREALRTLYGAGRAE